jgi:hypothetical protein
MSPILGLTPLQVDLCKYLWLCETTEDVDLFIYSLPVKKLRDQALLMKHMILATMLDDGVTLVKHCKLARSVIKDFQL